ncbi:hypothetical protein FDUTEX481_01989 [Tolypothrix sp. PCC 7601]|nr:hypothetical protein FDUTEX481_01989 [Tolypothrix sp. PCC 7601]
MHPRFFRIAILIFGRVRYTFILYRLSVKSAIHLYYLKKAYS